MFIMIFNLPHLAEQPSLDEIFAILENKSAEWIVIGRKLKVQFNFRENLRKDQGMDNPSRLEAVLHKWMESSPSTITWEFFEKELKNMGYLDCVRKVKDIQRQQKMDN